VGFFESTDWASPKVLRTSASHKLPGNTDRQQEGLKARVASSNDRSTFVHAVGTGADAQLLTL
jgi:hypothetical protein